MGKTLRVLLVDDDVDDRDLFIEAMKQIDRSIICYCEINGEEALKTLNKKPALLPDIIFLDLNMPRISGKQCLKALKNIELVKDIPVIIYTTSKREEDVAETSLLGACFFLVKPRSFDSLKSELTDALIKYADLKLMNPEK